MPVPTNHVDRVDSYFVCATPRTGSSLLLGLLESTGVAGHPQAYFRVPDEPLWAGRWRIPRGGDGGFDDAAFVRAALDAGRTDNGVFGAKLMWGTLDELVDRIGRLHPDAAGQDAALLERAFGRTRYVYLRRADVLAQAVSWLRAEQTQAWYVGGNGEISGGGGDGRAPHFDKDGIDGLLRTIDEHNAGWRAWFSAAGVRPHVVRYEDLDEDMVAVTREVLDFLGLDTPPGRAVAPRHHRQADDLNREWIRRYRAEPASGSTEPGADE
ncbi:Stf0 sulfotransferase [Micromonospora acroterricola]|uniref:Trehalose 2-sulfotransferase n=1 Tax=Micromonospora acroterricola TaxID=2202421 RepID=A0A317DAS6_9ACTN|nr:Stf0 family sulfotransferase [Micromonospora acroterricola]PWR11190.1 Stf0 sulfotransferase [Micromonospora acroterricola]